MLAESRAAPATYAYAVLCTDFPEIDDARLSALIAAIDAGDDSVPLCIPLLSGAAHGATVRTAAAGDDTAATASEVVPGLVAAAAHPSRYATVYAACVLRACALLSRSDDAIASALSSYVLLQAPCLETEDVPEVAVPEDDLGAAGDEVWAADPDDDDMAYEPIAVATPPPLAASLCGGTVRRCTHAEARERLGHLLGSLSHDALDALGGGDWKRLGIGDSLRGALGRLQEGRWTGTGGVGEGLGEGLGEGALRRSEEALACVLRDHLLHEPNACVAELPLTLEALAPPPRRPLFLASLLAGGGTARLAGGAAAASAWDAVEACVRAELVPLLEAVGETTAGLGAGAAVADAQLQTALQLLSCYLEPPPSRSASAASLLLSCGAPQLLVRLLLPPPPPPAPIFVAKHAGSAPAAAATAATAAAACRPLGPAWEWLLAACSRPELSAVLHFVAAVPAFAAAVRASAHLERRPAQRACWWLLLLAADCSCVPAAPRAPPAAVAAPTSPSVQAERAAESLVGVQALLSAGGTEALGHALELLSKLHAAVATLRPMLLHADEGRPILAELEAFHKRARAAAPTATMLKASDDPTSAVAGAADAERGPANGAEKAGELIARAAVAAKQLLQALRAPGKAD